MPAPFVLLFVAFPLLPGGPADAIGQEHELYMGSIVRITGATVLRGGPASPPRLYPTVIEGNIVGMRGDTMLFETGNEPVYWIPLGERPLVERRAAVSDMKRSILVTGAITGAAGATFALGLHDQCEADMTALAQGVVSSVCPEGKKASDAALRGFVIGTGIGVVAGAVLSRFFRRQGWVAIPLDQIRFNAMPGTGWAMSLRVGGRGGVP